jgi:hypothetical protein
MGIVGGEDGLGLGWIARAGWVSVEVERIGAEQGGKK